MVTELSVKSVAVIGAGASGTAAAAALTAEGCFDKIKVFDRREAAGGLWLYDEEHIGYSIKPGALPPVLDPPSEIPGGLPQQLPHDGKDRYHSTPIYESLTTTVPEIAMSFSDKRFANGPFVPHYVPRQYLQEIRDGTGHDRWLLTLRKHDDVREVDDWWQEEFDAVIIANGQHSVPYVPNVKGLEEYMDKYQGSVSHSKSYRKPQPFDGKKILIAGNSLSGQDMARDIIKVAQLPVYISRRNKSIWDGQEMDNGIEWKAVIREVFHETGKIVFEDGSSLTRINHIIYCTGYKPSFPFWNTKANGQELYDYNESRLNGSHLHTFFKDFPTLGIVGLGKTLAFRSYEYQAIALARLFAGKSVTELPSQEEWESWWEEYTEKNGIEFHEVSIEDGELLRWYTQLSNIAGLPLCGKGRVPPAFTNETIRQLKNVEKY